MTPTTESAAEPEDTVLWTEVRDAKLAAMTDAERAEYEAATYPVMAEFMLSQLVYDLRTEAGLTQTELAERAGTRASAVSAIEGGVRIPTVPMLMRLAEAVGKQLTISADTPA